MDDFRHMQAGTLKTPGHINKGAAIFLGRWRIHGDQAAAIVLITEIAAKAGVRRGRHTRQLSANVSAYPLIESLLTQIYVRITFIRLHCLPCSITLPLLPRQLSARCKTAFLPVLSSRCHCPYNEF